MLETPESRFHQFQSRNRDACHFRKWVIRDPVLRYHGFNLAIEMLVISGPEYRRALARDRPCFNLAIEMLVISGPTCFC